MKPPWRSPFLSEITYALWREFFYFFNIRRDQQPSDHCWQLFIHKHLKDVSKTSRPKVSQSKPTVLLPPYFPCLSKASKFKSLYSPLPTSPLVQVRILYLGSCQNSFIHTKISNHDTHQPFTADTGQCCPHLSKINSQPHPQGPQKFVPHHNQTCQRFF